MYQVENICD